MGLINWKYDLLIFIIQAYNFYLDVNLGVFSKYTIIQFQHVIKPKKYQWLITSKMKWYKGKMWIKCKKLMKIEKIGGVQNSL
jgi:hypothetical protein